MHGSVTVVQDTQALTCDWTDANEGSYIFEL